MNVGSTFSGVGGIDLGLERAGMRVVWNAEADEWCRGVLRHHWPDAVQYADVRDVGRLESAGKRGADTDAPESDGRTAPVDLLCGGFPCQDLSVAGKRAGLAGARSGLFHEYARITDALRPEWLLLENVPGLLSSNDGRDFGVLLGTLADLGYGVAWRVLNSRYFGVPQRRRRVFIVGRAGGDHASALRALCESCPGSPEAGECSWQGATSSPGSGAEGRGVVSHTLTAGGFDASEDGTGRSTPLVVANALDRMSGGPDDNSAQANHLVAATLSKGSAASPGVNPPGRRQGDDVNLVSFYDTGGSQSGFARTDGVTPTLKVGSSVGAPAGIGITAATGVRRLTPRECERLQGFPDDWTLVPDMKCPDSRRYAALGNAVTTNVAEFIGRRIHAIHLSTTGAAAPSLQTSKEGAACPPHS